MNATSELRFLVGGTARSGTTLVQRLACELPGVWVPQETHFWSAAEQLAGAFDWPLRGGDRHAAVEHALREAAGGALPANAAAVMSQVTARQRRVGLWTLFESLVAALSPPDRLVLGEKTPNHLLWWEQLTAAVESLRLVLVVRDPRDVLRSHRGVDWGEHDPYALAERWVAHQRAALDARRLLGPARVLLLRYEDVVADASGARSQVAGLLGVPDEPAPLDEGQVASYPLFPEREEWKSRALGEVEARPREGGLDAGDRAVIESVCGEQMAAVGYSLHEAASAAPEPAGVSLDRVRAFRRWHAGVAAAHDLPIY